MAKNFLKTTQMIYPNQADPLLLPKKGDKNTHKKQQQKERSE